MSFLPEKFCDRISNHLGSENSQLFFQALNAEAPVSIRFNAKKKALFQSKLNFDIDKKVEWNEDAVFLSKRPAFSKDPLYHSGLY